MTLAETWSELEADAPQVGEGRMTRRIHPESAADLHLAVEVTGPSGAGRRLFELTVDGGLLATSEVPRGTKLVDVTVESRREGRSALIFALEEVGAKEVFALMCEDLATAAAAAKDDESALVACVGRFEVWRRMLQRGSTPLSPARQRGLFAELVAIRDDLIPLTGFDAAVRAWLGPSGAPRDFELHNVAIETKSSAANEPQVTPINGERQLDDSGLSRLLLLHYSLEVLLDGGESLPSVVDSLRAHARGQQEAGTYEDRLLESGYLGTHVRHYERTGYVVRRRSLFDVRTGFPRIVEGDLPDGVGRVHYSLAIDACRDFEVKNGQLSSYLEGP